MPEPTLFMFTDVFPFGPFEHCAGVELGFLSEQFARVIVIPRRRGTHPMVRETPENVEVWDPFFPSDGKVDVLAKGLLNTAPVAWDRSISVASGWRKKVEAMAIVRRILSHPHRRIIEDSDPRSTLLYFYWGSNSAYVAPVLKTSAPIVVRMHGHDLYEDPPINPGFIPFREQLMRRANHITPVSEFGCRYLKEKYGDIDTDIRCARLGVLDPGRARPSSDGVLRLLTCSRIIGLKRLPMIAEAVQKLNRPVHWTHIGNGPNREEVDAAVEGLPVTLTGDFTNDQVYDFLRNNPVDLFLNVSTSEGVPLSIMEALGAGIPVYATDVGGTAELVDDALGRLLPPDVDSELLAKELCDFRGGSALRNAARKRWEERASAEVNYRAFADFLWEVATG